MNDSAYQAAALFVDALVRLGLRHACVTPGSRSTPLALAFAEHPDVTDWVHHDERSSAFFALGIAKVTRTPAAIITTSGTATAELLPAAVEARYAAVPLLLLTADRPPELRGIGAPQTIDQVNLFVNAARMSVDVVPADMPTGEIEALAVTAWNEAVRRPRRPVHINMGFREPFVPATLDRPTASVTPTRGADPVIDEDELRGMQLLLGGKRVLIVAGPIDEPGFPDHVLELAKTAGWPIVADPLSQLRSRASDLVLGAGDALFAAGRLPAMPEAIVRLGATVTSKAITTWLADHQNIPQIVVDEDGRDASRSAAKVLLADPIAFVRSLHVEPAPDGWTDLWTDADRRARAALLGAPFPSEPAVVEILAEHLLAESVLYVASSMPIRNVDRYLSRVDARVLSNRGANGIDGLISSALGVAATGRRTFALAGDLSSLHDVGSLATAGRLDLPITIIVVNNDGGGIFSFLPQSALPRHFERVFGTPHGLSFVPIADAFGLRAVHADTADRLASEISLPGLIEVTTNRAREVELQAAALERVASS
ncbi:MAG: 2-succinyl-5-enolpyruvyl-6-hydroxy-3-cyclohexene-1-carboxylic-acid synthase [Acidimicrobiia bacterium]